MHNARKGTNGVFLASHNDRNFYAANVDHINSNKSKENVYVITDAYIANHCDTFEAAEHQFYNTQFYSYLLEKNERYIKNHHPERVQTMEQYRTNARTAPEETIYQIGDINQHVDGKILLKVYEKFLEWQRKEYPLMYVMDYALHVDEAVPHIHQRAVWICQDKTSGSYKVGQAEALRQMGIQKPYPDKKTDRYNNEKVTFTKLCREKWEELCRNYGLDIYDERLEPSRTGRTLLDVQCQNLKEKNLNLIEENNRRYEKSYKLADEIDELTDEIEELSDTKKSLKRQIKSLEEDVSCLKDYLNIGQQEKLKEIKQRNKPKEEELEI